MTVDDALDVNVSVSELVTEDEGLSVFVTDPVCVTDALLVDTNEGEGDVVPDSVGVIEPVGVTVTVCVLDSVGDGVTVGLRDVDAVPDEVHDDVAVSDGVTDGVGVYESVVDSDSVAVGDTVTELVLVLDTETGD